MGEDVRKEISKLPSPGDTAGTFNVGLFFNREKFRLEYWRGGKLTDTISIHAVEQGGWDVLGRWVIEKHIR